jgi:aspartyl-tRNA(Asn)/glutamyl-tRNA(Gln) amidotransferase subunit A
MGRRLRAGDETPQSLLDASIARISAFDPLVGSFLTTTFDRARERAVAADRALARGIDAGPLHGVPYALKDIFDVAGIATTCNSRLMLASLASEDSALEARLRDAGAVLLGKLATHEFALGGPSFDLPFSPARNPWSLEHFTGGSSSGSGAAVAAGLTPLALGSDTSGSIRGPAFHCGVVGLKPTFGRLSRRGVFPLSYSLDHCGPMTWTVEDAAIALNVLAGFDPLDPASIPAPECDFTAGLDLGVEGLRVAYPRAFFAGDPKASPEIVARIDDAAQRLAALGAEVREIALPDFGLFNACGRIIMTAESYAIHEADIRARPRDYGRYTYQRIAPGAGLTAADMLQAQRVRRRLTEQLNSEVFPEYDGMITASSLSTAPLLSDFPPDWPPTGSTQTIAFSLTGNPALGVPLGLSKAGLPIGLQVVGRLFDETMVLRLGAALEAAFGPRTRPPLEPWIPKQVQARA